MMKEHYKHPRLYLKEALSDGLVLPVTAEQAHYLKNVLRKAEGDIARVFNGRDGEWASTIEGLGKKGGALKLGQKLREQPQAGGLVHLFFAPIRKARMDILIEKAVELGVDVFHPVITHRTENRQIKRERLEVQIFEAAEQCERMSIPVLREPQPLASILRDARKDCPLYVALERGEGIKPLAVEVLPDAVGFLIGPEGGFDDEEIGRIQSANVRVVSLGEAVLRAETAAMVCLTQAMLSKQRA